MIESLEQRKLLTASFNATTGVLTITGTTASDTISLGNVNTTTFVVSQRSGGQTTNTNFETARVRRININLLAGADVLSMGKIAIPARIDGGDNSDRIAGGPGRDTIIGGRGDDYIFGGDNRDFLDGGRGADDILGGSGKDIVDYSTRTAPLTIGLGTLPDDGEAGEADNVRTDVEIVFGGSGSDSMSTRSRINVEFYGNGGDDTLTGGNGNDLLVGGAGRDSLVGTGGVDTFRAQDTERDTIDGGTGTDVATNVDTIDTLLNIP
jgi:Ca2+-binding RTX toxin-like protein